jgi:hypothetical protein
MHHVNKGRGPKGGTYLVCSNARRGVNGCRHFSWKYQSVEKFILVGLQEVDYRELFPSLHAATETALQTLDKARATAEARLEKAKADRKRLVDLLMSRPESEALLTRLDEVEKSVAALTAEIERIAQETAAERRRLSEAEHIHQQAHTALEDLAKAHEGKDRAAVFDVRSRLHQLLRRTLERVTLTPSKDGELHGEIAVTFKGAKDYARLLRIERGQTRCVSLKVESGHPAKLGRHVEIVRGRLPSRAPGLPS